MAFEEDLAARIAATAGIASLIGTRVAWYERPRSGGFPAIVLTKIAPGREYKLSGAADELDSPRVQFDFFAEDAADALSLARQTRTLLETSATQGSTLFHQAMLVSEITYPPEDLEGGVKVNHIIMDFEIPNQQT
ncbi:MAG: DUF3168 domain-containing protein [Xanthomonadales bacterium]|nr:DUF3168 domain-containing protein [Xanthomonadales bacterium]